jgi:outer membrane biosynthesis protein TonB
MQVVSGKGQDSQWFDYRSVHFQPVNRVEWPLDTMLAALPAATANFLVGRNYARRATDAEVEAYTASVKTEPEPETAPEPETVPEPEAKDEPEPEPVVTPEPETESQPEPEQQNRRRRKGEKT